MACFDSRSLGGSSSAVEDAAVDAAVELVSLFVMYL